MTSKPERTRREFLVDFGAGAVTAVTAGIALPPGSAKGHPSAIRAGFTQAPRIITLGSNYSAQQQKAGLQAAINATRLNVAINTFDHNGYQDNFNRYIQNPDDVASWFGGYRLRALAEKGLVADLSDVWADLPDMTQGFKNASTAADGKQYFVPFTFYPWAIFYRRSLFAAKKYRIPKTWKDLLALCKKMKADGITPFSAVNDGNWPQMGMFDMISMRTNGYDFHLSLLKGHEDWRGPKVVKVFENWQKLLGYYQSDVNSRRWEDGADALVEKKTGMFLVGTWVLSRFDSKDPRVTTVVDDLDFFAFPSIVPAYGQDAVEAPIDGFVMAKSAKNVEGAKALLTALGSRPAIDAYLSVDPSVVAANSGANSAAYNRLQKKSVELVTGAKHISQFLDRDTDPDFAARVVGPAIKDFLNGKDLKQVLSVVEQEKSTYDFG